MRRRRVRPPVPTSEFAGFRFPSEVIVLAVRWYLRFALSYRDGEELLTERGLEADHVTVHRRVQRFTPLLVDVARPCRHRPGDRWFVDETYAKVAGRWTCLYRAVDQHDQVIDVLTRRPPPADSSPGRCLTAGGRSRSLPVHRACRWRLTADHQGRWQALLSRNTVVPDRAHRVSADSLPAASLTMVSAVGRDRRAARAVGVEPR